MWHEPDSPHAEYSATLELDLSTVQPSLAGPKRPQDRVLLGDMKANFHDNVGHDPGPRRQGRLCGPRTRRSEEHTSELQSLMRISYAVFCLKKKTPQQQYTTQ